jgi:two-component system, NarL family, sensor kinase
MSTTNTGLIIFLIVTTFVIAILIVFVILILFVLQKKQQTYLSQLKSIKLFYDKELFRAQLEIQEETFEHISREIHDNVGQFLSLAKLSLNTVDVTSRESAIEGIGSVTELLGTALDDLRDLSRNMNSEMIRNGGLKRAIEMQVGHLQRGGRFRVTFDIRGNYNYLNEQKEIILFRILQEAINNIIRHSCASDILILLCSIKQELKMYIQDNGKGFDTRYFALNENNISGGLKNMQKRARLINADIDIESSIGKGTKITVTTPI